MPVLRASSRAPNKLRKLCISAGDACKCEELEVLGSNAGELWMTQAPDTTLKTVFVRLL